MTEELTSVLRAHRDSVRVRAEPRLSPLDRWARRAVRIPAQGLRGLRSREQRQLREVQVLVEQLESLRDEGLRDRLESARARARSGVENGAEAVALASVVAKRTVGLTANPRQLLGALLLRGPHLVEMATGEGKTLTVALAAVGMAWTGRPLHVVTANDYLAARDEAWLGEFYRRCGCSSAALVPGEPPDQRRNAYRADVVYATSKELLADFLRDRLRLRTMVHSGRRLARSIAAGNLLEMEQPLQRGLWSAIVDEADHVLIDEAVTPLLISRKTENKPLTEAARIAQQLIVELQEGRDYEVSGSRRSVELTGPGKERLRELLAKEASPWLAACRPEELAETALQAREFFERDRHYIVANGKVVIVDEGTGRPMPDRTWKHGLHQAVEAKEGLEISAPSETAARMSFQRFFRLYGKLSGLTGTGWEARGEFWENYRLTLRRVPTYRKCQRIQRSDFWCRTAEGKQWAIVAEVASCRELGRPVLIGTRSVAASEALAKALREHGLEPEVLNARNLEEEARVVAAAGEREAVTIATNMAGRGTDIKLGEGVAALGGLHVIATERHASGRIDRQLYGRAGRQGDPGSARAFLSAEDELFTGRHAPVSCWMLRTLTRLPNGVVRRILSGWIVARVQGAWTAADVKRRRSVARTDAWVETSLGVE